MEDIEQVKADSLQMHWDGFCLWTSRHFLLHDTALLNASRESSLCFSASRHALNIYLLEEEEHTLLVNGPYLCTTSIILDSFLMLVDLMII